MNLGTLDFAPSVREQIGDMRPRSNRLGGHLNRRPKFGAARDRLHQNNQGLFDLKAIEMGLSVEFSDISLPLPREINHTNPDSGEESLQTESTSTTQTQVSSRPIANNYIMCRTQDETRRSTPSQSQRKKKDLSSSADDNTQIRIASKKPCKRIKRDTSNANGTYLNHFDIGDVGFPRDMAPQAPDASQVESLQTHDFAFVLRRNGQWTYAILAGRQEDALLFAVDSIGSVKRISKKHWTKLVRMTTRSACGGLDSEDIIGREVVLHHPVPLPSPY